MPIDWKYVVTPKIALLEALVVVIFLTGDGLLGFSFESAYADTLRALSDNLTHGLIAAISWAIVIDGQADSPRGALLQILLCGALGSLVDVDHFLAARSLKLKAALSLPQRPPFHATTVIPVISLVILVTQRLTQTRHLPYLPLLFLVSWLSHHTRDAVRRGYWMWPFGETPPLPYGTYVMLNIGLPLIVRCIVLYSKLSEQPHLGLEVV
ncbi:transmembrane protein 267-like [Lingula anatina]|uniref:Transmembrane protein 267 n=1 Tax=Lingula anatina TaxID=7574 RepID=A0A1S3JMI2_LINAN|nr:transmembrane protein 267-like [Lingula anatina]|eukprot:XP_013411603.1 transmembrane protein 267-like [Lingula anatina]